MNKYFKRKFRNFDSGYYILYFGNFIVTGKGKYVNVLFSFIECKSSI